MIYRGMVKGNVVTLEPGAQIPDGTAVHVQTDEPVGSGRLPDQCDLFQIGDCAVEAGIPDLATNADHNLYGHPKVIHAG